MPIVVRARPDSAAARVCMYSPSLLLLLLAQPSLFAADPAVTPLQRRRTHLHLRPNVLLRCLCMCMCMCVPACRVLSLASAFYSAAPIQGEGGALCPSPLPSPFYANSILCALALRIRAGVCVTPCVLFAWSRLASDVWLVRVVPCSPCGVVVRPCACASA